jgi:hypothetical protein
VAPNATFRFLTATPASVTIAAGDVIQVTSTITLGTSAGPGANNLSLTIASAVGASAPVGVGPGVAGLSVSNDDRHTFTLSALITGLAAGTYNVGMAGNTGNSNWDLTGNAYTTALVIRP